MQEITKNEQDMEKRLKLFKDKELQFDVTQD